MKNIKNYVHIWQLTLGLYVTRSGHQELDPFRRGVPCRPVQISET